jgi:hypothetical protein
MLKAFAIVFNEGLAEDDSVLRLLFAFLRLLAAMRTIFFSGLISKYQNLNILEKLSSRTQRWDPLYFAVHKFHLCRNSTFRERLQCAMYHHEYEAGNYKPKYFVLIHLIGGIQL